MLLFNVMDEISPNPQINCFCWVGLLYLRQIFSRTFHSRKGVGGVLVSCVDPQIYSTQRDTDSPSPVEATRSLAISSLHRWVDILFAQFCNTTYCTTLTTDDISHRFVVYRALISAHRKYTITDFIAFTTYFLGSLKIICTVYLTWTIYRNT